MNTFSKMKTASDEEKDRLSNLPECILCHILSFLPTKDAAKTPLLSKRWIFLFLAVPKIDVTDDNDSVIRPETVDLINSWLMLCRTTSITSFRLSCGMLPEASLFHTWVRALLFGDAQVLDIEFRDKYAECALKCSLSKHLVWGSLVVLKLNGKQIAYKLPESVLFPNLKVLNLIYLELQSQSKTCRFSDECYPLLEELRLEEVITSQETKDSKPLLDVSLPTLKTLKLVAIYLDEMFSQVDVYTPHLHHLELHICGGADPKMEMNMCYMESIKYVYFNNLFSRCPLLTGVLCKVNNVKKLDLSQWGAQGLVDYVPLLKFPNLINLKIYRISQKQMWNLLQHSPRLETFEFTEGCLYEKCCPDHSENAPLCFAKAIKGIRIRGFIGNDAGFERVSFILEHGVVLQTLIMHAYREWTLSTAKKLLELKRESPNCQIMLVKQNNLMATMFMYCCIFVFLLLLYLLRIQL